MPTDFSLIDILTSKRPAKEKRRELADCSHKRFQLKIGLTQVFPLIIHWGLANFLRFIGFFLSLFSSTTFLLFNDQIT
jgi:hypothetical protein